MLRSSVGCNFSVYEDGLFPSLSLSLFVSCLQKNGLQDSAHSADAASDKAADDASDKAADAASDKTSKQRGALKGGAPRVTFLHKLLLFSLISEGMPDYCSACATI